MGAAQLEHEIPTRSLAQRMSALERANDIRFRRARLKRDMKAGKVSAGGVLYDPPEYVDTMKLWDLLMATPKVGRVKVNRIFVTCRISPSKTIGGLTDRQRGELLAFLPRP